MKMTRRDFLKLSSAAAASIFRGNAQKTYFFTGLPSRVFRPFYGKFRDFSPVFRRLLRNSALFCIFVQSRKTTTYPSSYLFYFSK